MRDSAPRGRTDQWLPPEIARRLRFSRPQPAPGRFRTAYSEVTIAMDADRPGGWMVLLDDVLASYVDLRDPQNLEFEYTRWIADLVDEMDEGALRILHLGGAACTLPVYFECTRPGSRQLVAEYDADLIDLMREQFGIRSSRPLAIRCIDGLQALRDAADASYDVIVRDAFHADQTPEHLHDLPFAHEVRRVLSPGGMYLANIGDRPGLALTRELLATTAAAFELGRDAIGDARMAFICEPSVLRGRRLGNVVMAASARRLPLHGWVTATRRAALPARITHGERLLQYLS